MTELPPIPMLPAGFTPEFVTSALRASGTIAETARVQSLQCMPVGEGTGMMSEVARLTVSYADASDEWPASFIAKYASQNETNRQIALQYNLYERETRYLAELDPHTRARTPKAYVCGRQADRFLILMEDMTDYAVGSQVEGADLQQTELAIDELAKLHSAFWNRVDHLDWVPHIAGSYHADNMQALGQIGFDGVLEKFGDLVPAHIAAAKARFHADVPRLQALMDTPPLTLVHGDYRMENLLYGRAPEHDPVAVIDWQGPLIARGLNDVALFLGQSTRTEVRRKHERTLIKRYLEGLRAGGVEDVSFAEFWQAYRVTVLYNWLYAIVVAGTLDSSHEKAYAWMSEMLKRQVAAMEDLDALALLSD